MILGDHPCVSNGPPITIDWHHEQEELVNIDHHIKMTPLPRRQARQMVMPTLYRKLILTNAGCCHREMVKVMEETKIIRAQRMITIRSLDSFIDDEIKEKFKRKMKRLIPRTQRMQNLNIFSNMARCNSVHAAGA